MLRKGFFSAVCLVFACLSLDAQSPANIRVKFCRSDTTQFTIQFMVADVNYEVDENGVVLNAYRPVKNSFDDNNNTSYWQAGWGEKTGKIKSVGNTDLDYWSSGWGPEKTGKVKAVGPVLFDYWAPGWGREKAGKLKSIGDVSLDYWSGGWGKEKEGKIKLIGSVSIDYWSGGWGEKEGKIRSVTGQDKNVEILVSFL